ncbi:hypothetical protein GCM10010275_37270 [Streptomyces litmocidini]|uniref:hypothetical protein n=1 Tax=Streptomyces litmocidini TaxID=67318 RepID=UPI00167ECEC9|nr:hypothetical protein [Streptomyces litmocidini]GGU95830.1 hypothetical protein GCM10010275_37270 [Streptomyces litmocidini]
MADDPLTAFVRTVLGSGAPVIVLPPHLDDAVLSCGALLGRAGRRAPVTVATLFTEAAPPPYALSARRHLRRARAGDAESTGRHRLTARAGERGPGRKAEPVRGYRAQADALFPGGRVPHAPGVHLLTDVGRGRGRLPGPRPAARHADPDRRRRAVTGPHAPASVPAAAEVPDAPR